MGMIQSICCTITFCVERVLTWALCALMLVIFMGSFLVLMTYGISVGYHYAQKELSSLALLSRSTTEETKFLRSGIDSRPVVRLVAVNRSEVDRPPPPIIEVYQTNPRHTVFLDTTPTPIMILETEIPAKEPALSPNERDLARRLIGRFRRSKNFTSTDVPFLRPLKNSTVLG